MGPKCSDWYSHKRQNRRLEETAAEIRVKWTHSKDRCSHWHQERPETDSVRASGRSRSSHTLISDFWSPDL